MLSKALQSSARASAGVFGWMCAVLLSTSLAVLACGASAYAAGLRTTAPPSAAASQSEGGVLPAAAAAVQPPAAAAASATSAVAQSAGTIVPASASTTHTSGRTLGTAAGAAAQAIAAAPKGGSAGGPAASEVLVHVRHAVSRTLAPVAGAAHVLKAGPPTAAQMPAQTLADVLTAASRPGGAHLVASGREAILRVLRPTTPAAAAAIQRAAEALAGARGGAPSLPLLPPLSGLGEPPIPGLVAPLEAGLLDLATGAAPAPTREVFAGTLLASRTLCTIAGAEGQITQRCGAAPLPVLGQGSTPFTARAAVLASRAPPVETYLGGAHASARSAGVPGAPSPGSGTGGTAGSAAGALGSPFPTLLLLAGLLLVGIPRLTRRLSLVCQRCIAAPFALIPERPG